MPYDHAIPYDMHIGIHTIFVIVSLHDSYFNYGFESNSIDTSITIDTDNIHHDNWECQYFKKFNKGFTRN